MTEKQAIKLLSKDTSISEIHRLRDEGLSHTEVIDKIQEAMDMGADALKNDNSINRLISYIKSQEIELSLKLEYSLHYGWIVKVIRKGYDIPIVEVNNDNLDNAIEITYAELNKLEEI